MASFGRAKVVAHATADLAPWWLLLSLRHDVPLQGLLMPVNTLRRPVTPRCGDDVKVFESSLGSLRRFCLDYAALLGVPFGGCGSERAFGCSNEDGICGLNGGSASHGERFAFDGGADAAPKVEERSIQRA